MEVELPTECEGEGCSQPVIEEVLVSPMTDYGVLARLTISAGFAVTVLCLFVTLVRATGLQSGMWVKIA